MPDRGDFVSRRLDRAFLNPWDDWLQQAIASSRDRLRDDWLPLYLAAPVWRFALSGGVCGSDPVLGVLMPSVDSAGRYYPFTLAWRCGRDAAPTLLLAAGEAWLDAAEELALSVLEDGFEFARFEKAVAGLPDPMRGLDAASAEASAQWGEGLRAIRIAAGQNGALPAAFGALLHGVLRSRFPHYSLWWTRGSPQVPSSLLVANALPPIGCFAALLDGRWGEWGWAGALDGGAPLAAARP